VILPGKLDGGVQLTSPNPYPITLTHTLFMTKTAAKLCPLTCTYLYSPYKGVPPLFPSDVPQFSSDIIYFSKVTVFPKLYSRETVRFSEQIMSAFKYQKQHIVCNVEAIVNVHIKEKAHQNCRFQIEYAQCIAINKRYWPEIELNCCQLDFTWCWSSSL